MNGKWVVVLAAVLSLSGCIAPGEAEDFDMELTLQHGHLILRLIV